MVQDSRGGHPTCWREFGDGPREALLIHCSLAHSGAWKGVAAQLGGSLHMRAFDLPGHGRSGPWTGERDMCALSTAMAADMVGADGPMDVIGHSFGAVVALSLAIEQPALVRSLVIIESVFVAAALADDPELAARYGQKMKPYTDALERGDKEAAAREFLRDWGDGTPWEALPAEQRAAMAAQIHLIAANSPSVLEDRPGLVKNRLIETVKVPVLLIRGAKSPPIMQPVHAAIARRLPNARSIAIPGAAHMAPITHPGPVADAIAGFLESVPE
jgi:pimeloyl-ACP methyl ester carboxylesterase